MLVSGVLSSCEASATNSRWRSSDCSRSEWASSSAWSIPSIVRASSPTSSSVSGTGMRLEGSRVLVIWRARPVSALIGRIARSATASPASSASSVPPSTPAPRKNQSLATVSLTPPSGRAYWTKAGREPVAVIGSVATLELADVVDALGRRAEVAHPAEVRRADARTGRAP